MTFSVALGSLHGTCERRHCESVNTQNLHICTCAKSLPIAREAYMRPMDRHRCCLSMALINWQIWFWDTRPPMSVNNILCFEIPDTNVCPCGRQGAHHNPDSSHLPTPTALMMPCASSDAGRLQQLPCNTANNCRQSTFALVPNHWLFTMTVWLSHLAFFFFMATFTENLPRSLGNFELFSCGLASDSKFVFFNLISAARLHKPSMIGNSILVGNFNWISRSSFAAWLLNWEISFLKEPLLVNTLRALRCSEFIDCGSRPAEIMWFASSILHSY